MSLDRTADPSVKPALETRPGTHPGGIFEQPPVKKTLSGFGTGILVKRPILMRLPPQDRRQAPEKGFDDD